MLFNSWIFTVFFGITFSGFFVLRRTGLWLAWLLLASYLFYGWLNPLYVALIVYTTAVTYIAGIRIGSSANRSQWLAFGVVNNVFVLGVFKYAGFAAQNLNVLLHLVTDAYTIPEPGHLLPTGLSFYTFIATGYLIDCWRGSASPERNFVRLAAFVAFFPYLLAGPIERGQNMLPQLRRVPALGFANLSEGLSLFVVGLFKKIALADFLALYVNKVYAEPGAFGGFSLLVATYAFAWQIYFDFSGYTDMARGCARLMGFDLILNFNNPYLSASLRDFWQRWHISLSSWFKDYLYIPLGGNRCGRVAIYRNMVITMLVAGLWHGAAWNFFIWGALHALGRTVTRELEATRFYAERVPRLFKQCMVFHFVCLTWVFFRAESFGKAVEVLSGVFTNAWRDPLFPFVGLVSVPAIWAYQFAFESPFRRYLELSAVKVGLMTFMVLYMVFFGTSGYEVFLYFRF